MSKTKRMIYVWDENVEFYDKLPNKSEFLNEAMKTARLGGVDSLKVTEVEEGEVAQTSNVGEVHDSLAAMRERDAKRLAEYRAKKGLYDPTKAE